jgi:MFS family permease
MPKQRSELWKYFKMSSAARNVKLLKLISLLDGIYFSTIVSSIFLISKGIDPAIMISMQAVYSATILGFEVPTGVVADKFGAEKSINIGYFIGFLGLILLSLSPTVSVFVLSVVLRAFGSTLVSGADEALLYESCKSANLNYKQETSKKGSNELLGSVLTGLVVSAAVLLFKDSAYHGLMYGTAAVQFIIVILTLKLSDKQFEIKESSTALQIINKSAILIKTNKIIRTLAIVGGLIVVNEYFFYGFYAQYLKEQSVSDLVAGFVFTLGSLLNYFLYRNSYKLEKYLTFEKALVVIKLSSVLLYGYLAVATNNYLVTMASIALIASFKLESPIVNDYINQEIDSEVRATVLSSLSLISRLSKMITTFGISAVVGATSLKTGFGVQAGFTLIGLAISYWLLVRCGCVNKVRHSLRQPAL